jgi:hypothetical protein
VEHEDEIWFETYQRRPSGEVVFLLAATEEHQSLPLISQAGFCENDCLCEKSCKRSAVEIRSIASKLLLQGGLLDGGP